MAARWVWSVGDAAPATAARRQLTRARGRRVTWRLDAASDAQFSIRGGHEEAGEVVALATDLWCWRNNELLYRGRIGPEADDIGPTSHTVTFSSIDYRGMLANRILGTTGADFINIDQAQILWQMIATSQAQAGGSWGVTEGVGSASGVLRSRTFDPFKRILDAGEELGRVDSGFEWEISPTLQLNRWHPTRGVDNGVVLDHGGVISGVRRLLDPGEFANVQGATGSTGLTPVLAVAAGISTDPRGRWESATGFPSILQQSTVGERAPWLLAQSQVLRPTMSVTFAPDRWEGRSHVWLGDTVSLRVPSSARSFDGPHRVMQIMVTLSSTGKETVTADLVVGAAVNGVNPALAQPFDRVIRQIDGRLRALELAAQRP